MPAIKPRLRLMRVPFNPDVNVLCAGCHMKAKYGCSNVNDVPCVDRQSNFVWINVNWWKGKQDRPVNSESPVEQEQV